MFCMCEVISICLTQGFAHPTGQTRNDIACGKIWFGRRRLWRLARPAIIANSHQESAAMHHAKAICAPEIHHVLASFDYIN